MASADQEHIDAFVIELSIKAAEMIETCASPHSSWEWPHHPDELKACLRTAIIDASHDQRCNDGLDTHFQAAHIACRLIRHTDRIFRDGVPTPSDELIGIGASSFMTGWATQVAIFTLNFAQSALPENENDPPAPGGLRLRTNPFMSVLDELDVERTAQVHHRIVAELVTHIDGGNSPLAAGKEHGTLAELLPEAAPPRPASTTDPRPPTEVSSQDQPPSSAPLPVISPEASLPRSPASPGSSPGNASQPRWVQPVVIGAVSAALGALVGAGAIHQLSSPSKTSASAPLATIASNTETPSPLGPELAFADPTLDRVALRLYAYPDDSSLSERVMAVPEHPTQARAVISTGQHLIVEIHLMARPNAVLDPTETFRIGLAPSGLLTLQEGSSRVSNPGAQPLLELPKGMDLTPTPTTPITLDLTGTQETVYTVRLEAKAQPRVIAAPGAYPGYFCGFNTQYVNAVIVSSKATEVEINTTLPVSVLRAGSSC